LCTYLVPFPRDPTGYARQSAPDRLGIVLAMSMPIMTTSPHPYRTPSAEEAAAAHPCIVCRARAALAHVRWRPVLMGGALFAFMAVNVATAAVTLSSMRLAEKMLAAANSLDHVARGTLANAPKPVVTAAPRTPQTAQAPTPPVQMPSLAPPSSHPVQCAASRARLERGVFAITPTEYVIEHSFVDRALEEQSDRMRLTRIVPETHDGKVLGITVFGVAPESLLGQLGIENGDTLQTINGFDISAPEVALEAYARLRTATDLTVRLKRHGAPVTLRYHIR
jgi:hypothetical protein